MPRVLLNRPATRVMLVLLLAQAATDCAPQPATAQATASKAPIPVRAGKALFDLKCKTEAGEKIYRTVKDVDGIVLLKIRPDRTDNELGDRNWPGAAFAREFRGDGYIEEFLGVEQSTRDAFTQRADPIVPPKQRGYITSTPTDGPIDIKRPGYRFVDVQDEKTGQWWRYTYVRKPRPTSKIGWIDTVLERVPAPPDRPRYGVTFVDHVVEGERALGVASSTVKVIDLQSGEVLGESTEYAWTPVVLYTGPRTADTSVPWLTASVCGPPHSLSGFDTRLFVDQVLQPRTATTP